MKIPAATPEWFLYTMLVLIILAIVFISIYAMACGKREHFKKECLKCKHGESNFWGYTECWKFNQEIDGATTSETADREITAMKLNINGECEDYEAS